MRETERRKFRRYHTGGFWEGDDLVLMDGVEADGFAGPRPRDQLVVPAADHPPGSGTIDAAAQRVRDDLVAETDACEPAVVMRDVPNEGRQPLHRRERFEHAVARPGDQPGIAVVDAPGQFVGERPIHAEIQSRPMPPEQRFEHVRIVAVLGNQEVRGGTGLQYSDGCRHPETIGHQPI